MTSSNSPICSNCEVGILHYDARSVRITNGDLSVMVKDVQGFFCDDCGNIEFDDSTDSAQRYAAAGDELVLRKRTSAAER